jgi:hypothetical protein
MKIRIGVGTAGASSTPEAPAELVTAIELEALSGAVGDLQT